MENRTIVDPVATKMASKLKATLFSGIVGLPFYYLIREIAIGNSLLVLTGFGLLFTVYLLWR